MNFDQARKHMVDSQVRPNDVTDLNIQRALQTLPREVFLPSEFRDQAYIDRELAYAPGRSLIPARDFGKLLNALDIEKTDLALDVACGAGYSAAVLAALSEMVVAVESDEKLAEEAQAHWAALGIVNAAVIVDEPSKGAPKQGPFDIIIIPNAIETEPVALLSQLKDGGRLGAIVRADVCSKGVIWRRSGDAFGRFEVFNSSAQVVTPGFEKIKTFVF
ncbi:MAG: protein-L-isoaspartate O-methyltransferase [Parvularculaceae bacterium]